MEIAIKIIEREIAQRELAQKHNHLRKKEVQTEIEELNKVLQIISNAKSKKETLIDFFKFLDQESYTECHNSGTYLEAANKYIEEEEKEQKPENYPCPQCQGGGCPFCSGYGVIPA